MRRGRVWLCKSVTWGKRSSYAKSALPDTQTRALLLGARVTVVPTRPAHYRLRRKRYWNQNNSRWLNSLENRKRFNDELVASCIMKHFSYSWLGQLHSSNAVSRLMQVSLVLCIWPSDMVHCCIINGTLICNWNVYGAVVIGTWLPRHTY